MFKVKCWLMCCLLSKHNIFLYWNFYTPLQAIIDIWDTRPPSKYTRGCQINILTRTFWSTVSRKYMWLVTNVEFAAVEGDDAESPDWILDRGRSVNYWYCNWTVQHLCHTTSASKYYFEIWYPAFNFDYTNLHFLWPRLTKCVFDPPLHTPPHTRYLSTAAQCNTTNICNISWIM